MMGRAGAGLFRVVFRSRSASAARDLDVRDAIEAILDTARRRNLADGVTSALTYMAPFYLQAIEGGAAAVEDTFGRICCDLRHAELEVLECGPVLERAFGHEPMSFLAPAAWSASQEACSILGRERLGGEIAALRLLTVAAKPSVGRA